jgi:ABC-type multidrug transport system fused ATPase/permease subunit
MIPLVFVYIYIGIQLQQSTQQLRREVTRLQSITGSPISQAFTELIYGGKTVRAFGVEEYILEDYQNIIDQNLKNVMINNAAKQQFQQQLQFLSFLIIVPAILLAVIINIYTDTSNQSIARIFRSLARVYDVSERRHQATAGKLHED